MNNDYWKVLDPHIFLVQICISLIYENMSGQFIHSKSVCFWYRMARGQQKIQSQAKAAEKAAKVKKQQGHSANEQKKAAQKALVHVCSVCKVRIFRFIFILLYSS